MKRRSFLGLIAGIVAAPAAVKAAPAFGIETPDPNDRWFGVAVPDCGGVYQLVTDRQGYVIGLKVRSDVFCDGQITAKPISVQGLSAISANMRSASSGFLQK